ncbi:MAG: tail fiber domain-containing protein [Rhodobacteraceae bacterium]|nr:tail fiber domain-containing protein [Paracoccaceae bacterium]
MRFAGSGISFEAPTLASASGGTGAAAAAGVVDIGNAFATARSKAPRWDELSTMAMQANSAEKQAGMAAESQVTGAGIQALGQTQGMALQAKAAIKAADKQASAQKSSGIMSAVGGIASAGLALLSDESTKTDVEHIDTALEKLRNLKPVTFHYKEEFSTSPERMHHGFIAQEFQKVLPDATYYDESLGKMCIDTGDVIGLLVRANQELEERIGMLEAKQALATV